MKFVVDPPELHKASQKLAQLSENYTTVHNRLINTASTMGDAWNAADNLAFVEQIRGFCDDLEAMARHLSQVSEAVKQQALNYEAARDNNVTGVKKLVN